MELSQLRDELDDSRRESATLQSLRQHYAELFDTAPVACVTMDLLGRVLECNSAFLELVGLNAKPAADLFLHGYCVQEPKAGSWNICSEPRELFGQ
jgi:PAS domain-containing protein